MKITEILTPEMVIPQLRGSSKPDVLSELAQRLCKGHPEVAYDRLLGVLNERERLGSTAIGDGIAIPHGKLRGCSQILGVFGRSTAGVDFDSLDGNPTHLFFLLIAPEDSASLHLKALARVSRLFKDGAFRQHLLDASDGAELYTLLKEEDNKY